tara:strand:+ start:5756 stop:6295 length:540 start_codon:yes stop_codon:yes gene_type:complete
MIEIVSMWSGTPAPTVVDIDNYLSKPKNFRTESRLSSYSGYMAGIAASAIYGGLGVLGKKVAADSHPMVATGFGFLFGFLLMSLFFGHTFPRNIKKSVKSTYGFLILSGLTTGFGVSSWYMALSLIPVIVVAPVVSAYPLFTIGLSAIFLRNIEKITYKTIVGALLVLVGITVVGLGNI